MDRDPGAQDLLKRVLGVELELLRVDGLQILQPRPLLLREKWRQPGEGLQVLIPAAANVYEVVPGEESMPARAGRTSSL